MKGVDAKKAIPSLPVKKLVEDVEQPGKEWSQWQKLATLGTPTTTTWGGTLPYTGVGTTISYNPNTITTAYSMADFKNSLPTAVTTTV